MTRRKRTQREHASDRTFNLMADRLLSHASQLFDENNRLDTAVRDEISEAIARLVRAAFDTRACAMQFKDIESWAAFIDSSTAQWMRDRGFAEWFCAAAATGFNTSRPRIMAGPKSEMKVRVFRSRVAKRKKAA